MKFLLPLLLLCSWTMVHAQHFPLEARPEKKRSGEKHMPPPPPHPLLFMLESEDIPAAERERLKVLSFQDPMKFHQEVRGRLQTIRENRRKQWLSLRERYRSASESERPAIREEIRKNMEKEATRRLDFHKRLLDSTAEGLRMMQKRFADLETAYKKQQSTRDEFIRRRTEELTGSEVPKFLLPREKRSKKHSAGKGNP